MTFSRITIIGLGLIGGSLARDLKAQENPPHITGCNRNADSLETAKTMGLIDVGTTDPAEAVKDAELVIIGSPLSTYASILRAIKPSLAKSTVVTEVGSAKSCVIDAAKKALNADQFTRFIPAHPIAGSEKSGVEASVKGLYQNKRLIITPHKTMKKPAMKEVQQLWEQCGAEVETMDAARHDRIYAENSHVVQLLAYAFKDTMRSIPNNDPNLAVFTRLCSSNPAMWKDIFAFNDEAISTAKEQFIEHFSKLQSMITNYDTEALTTKLSISRVLRHRIAPLKQPQPSTCPIPFMLMPHLIACALMQTATERAYVGSGFKDFTENLLSWNTLKADDFMQNAKDVLQQMEAFQQVLKNQS